MLHKAQDLRTYELHSREGKIGDVADLYFDDRHWTVRYLVVDTGGWLTARPALISPWSVLAINRENKRVDTSLTREQVEKSPSPDENPPVSRQYEMMYNQYYGYAPYWVGPYAWGAFTVPRMTQDAVRAEERESWDSHLYSSLNVAGFAGYTVEAIDGDIGHVADLLVSDDDWAVRYLVIDTRDWLPGKHVLIPPQWAAVDWKNVRLSVDLTKDAIKTAPGYDGEKPVTRDYEADLYGHYCRKGYWSDDSLCYDTPAGITPGRPDRS